MPNPFFETPRTRRLRRDLEEMKVLADQSSIMSFRAEGSAPEEYEVIFDGKGLAPDGGLSDRHVIHIHLGIDYPRGMPQVKWQTPILHPNINTGNPCFGTFMMNPNVKLVDLVEILWDMTRMATYNPYHGYGGYDQWSTLRKTRDFPVDRRIVRDKAPVEDRPVVEDDDGEPDLIIMGASLEGHLKPSEQWVKMALEQFFQRRGLEDRVEILTGDEWAETGRPRYQDMVAGIVLDERFYRFTQSGSPEAEAFNEQLWRVFEKLGVLPNAGSGNVWPLLPAGFSL